MRTVLAALCLVSTAPWATAAAVSAPSNTFHPLALDRFYKRPLSYFKPTDSWGQVPQGVTNFDGVPWDRCPRA